MLDPDANIMQSLTVDQYKVCRSSIISMVLSTDMINHFEYITKFKNKVNGEGMYFIFFYLNRFLRFYSIQCIRSRCQRLQISIPSQGCCHQMCRFQ